MHSMDPALAPPQQGSWAGRAHRGAFWSVLWHLGGGGPDNRRPPILHFVLKWPQATYTWALRWGQHGLGLWGGTGRYRGVLACLCVSLKAKPAQHRKGGWLWCINVYYNFSVKKPFKSQRINWGNH